MSDFRLNKSLLVEQSGISLKEGKKYRDTQRK